MRDIGKLLFGGILVGYFILRSRGMKSPDLLLDPDASPRPFDAVGDAPGSMTESAVSIPIQPVPGIPGGTLYNPVMRSVPAGMMAPTPGGTNTRVSVNYGRSMAAQTYRGHGPSASAVEIKLAHSGTRSPGVSSQFPVVEAIARIDRSNPIIAKYTQPGMKSGSTRIFGDGGPAPIQKVFTQVPASVPQYALPDTKVSLPGFQR